MTLLDLPFFDDRHRELAARLQRFTAATIEPQARSADSGDPNEAAKCFNRTFASEGLLRLVVPQGVDGASGTLDLRSICLAREAIASSSALADAVLAVQGLGSFPITSAGDAALKRRYLPRVAAGEAIAAFALTEPEAGSDISAIQTSARQDGDEYVLNGTKTFISNAGIADFYVVFAKTDERGGKRGLSAFVVDAGSRGFAVTASLDLIAPHPIGTVEFASCRVPADHQLGVAGDGLRIALSTLDMFRPSVGAAACGLAARALREARSRALERRQFGSPLSEFQVVRFALAEMATELDAARLLVYRAAWMKDQGVERVTRQASMAKLFATEAAQRVVDRAVQMHGGAGVTRGNVVERLYREVRALRIYEGTSEIQHLIIADQLLKEGASQDL